MLIDSFLLLLLNFLSLTFSASACSSAADDEPAASAAAPAVEAMARVRVGRLRIFPDAARLFLETMSGGGDDQTTTGPVTEGPYNSMCGSFPLVALLSAVSFSCSRF